MKFDLILTLYVQKTSVETIFVMKLSLSIFCVSQLFIILELIVQSKSILTLFSRNCDIFKWSLYMHLGKNKYFRA